ncbi:MAG TPA: STAS domain-containing protein [Acidimicrobiales bacterium]|nr:STAS domain-containing protein [Acidimicrobiales bacterium]
MRRLGAPLRPADDDPPQLSLSCTSTPERVIVAVRGEVDACTSGQLKQQLIDVMDGAGNLPVEADLGDMTFIDSSGLSVLVEMHLEARSRGTTFVLLGARPSAAKVFEIVGLNSILTFR